MIRIMIADRHPIVRQGLKRTLSASGVFGIVVEVDTSQKLWDNIQTSGIDVLVCDISMFGNGAFQMLAEIKRRRPYLAIVVFSMYVDIPYVTRSLRGGATAYVSKAASAEELKLAIHHAVSGKQYVDSTLQYHSFDQSLDRRVLSPRESEVLQLIVEGKKTNEIARELGLSVKTVSTHRAHILDKMNLSTNQQMVRDVLQQRLQPDSRTDAIWESELQEAM